MWALAGAMIWVAPMAVHAGVRECTPDQIKAADDGYSTSDQQGHRMYHRDDAKNHQLFHLEPTIYDHPIPGGPNGYVTVVVTTDPG